MVAVWCLYMILVTNVLEVWWSEEFSQVSSSKPQGIESSDFCRCGLSRRKKAALQAMLPLTQMQLSIQYRSRVLVMLSASG